jgi:hypothetical protein
MLVLPIVTVAVRVRPSDGTADATKVTVALPMPLAGVTASHGAVLVAVHPASTCDATSVMLCEPPANDGFHDEGVAVTVAVLPLWDTWTTRPAMVTVPARETADSAFGAAVSVRV